MSQGLCRQDQREVRAKRQALAELLEYIREDDTVRIASMDRLGRDTRDLYYVVTEITDKGAAVHFVKEKITVDKTGRLRGIL